MKYQQKNYLFLVFALFMGCMVLFNSCDPDDADSIDCLDLECGEHGTCGISAGLAVCFCDSSANGVLLYDGENCENCIEHGGPCPENSHCTELGCVCDSLYIQDPDGTGCIFDSTNVVNPTDSNAITRDSYIGNYQQTDSECVGPIETFNYTGVVTVAPNPTNENELLLDNLSELSLYDDLVTVVLETNMTSGDLSNFRIPLQTTEPTGHIFEGLGVGTYQQFDSGDTFLTIKYRVLPFGGIDDTCSLTLAKL